MKRAQCAFLVCTAYRAAVLLFATVVALPARLHTQPAPPTRADTIALLRDSLTVRADRFFVAWRGAWVRAEQQRIDSARREGFGAQVLELKRAPWVHCHGPLDTSQSRGPGREIQRAAHAAIGSFGTAFSVCPSWLLSDRELTTPAPTERDSLLLPSDGDTLRAARRALTAAFAAASKRHPDEPLFIGQWVRHLMEAGHRDSALQVAMACRSDRWWCEALRAWTLYHGGEPMYAETAFANARAAMPFAVRCLWDDVRELVPEPDEAPLVERCDQLLAFADTLFWLADPLWEDDTNERRLQHDVRTMELTLATQLPQDERYRWSERYRGDAVARMVLRYGWPTVRRWGGKGDDEAHDRWMVRTASAMQRPYTTHEYTRDRVHLVPTWSALRRPTMARASDWVLGATSEAEDDWWWPQEHVPLARPLRALEAGQWGFLRRADSAVLFVAHDHPAGADRMPLASTLVMTTSPVQRHVVARREARADSVFTFVNAVAGEAALLGVELRETEGAGRDWRTRFGVSPPAPLRVAARDTVTAVALSDLLLLRATEAMPTHTDSDAALARQMLGSLVVSRAEHPAFTVLWERYDFAPTDSVSYTLTIERADTRSAWQRLGAVLRLRRDPRTFVQIRWTEQAGAQGPVVDQVAEQAQPRETPMREALVRAYRHAVRVNVQPLEVGVYDLQVEARTPSGRRAWSGRRITLAP
jgi:hypothetical protein